MTSHRSLEKLETFCRVAIFCGRGRCAHVCPPPGFGFFKVAAGHRFELSLAAGWPLERWRDLTVLVACSGGADSTALVRAMHAVKAGGAGTLVVAHYNHLLRGAE